MKEQTKAILVSANWINGVMRLALMRNVWRIDSQEIFGEFDSSMNQTDRVLTKDNCDLFRQAQPGDKLQIEGHKGCYILNLRVE